MSIKKLITIGFVTYALVLSGCFSTDSDDDDKVDTIDSVTVQTALDSLGSLAGTTEIDSSMKYSKSGTTYTMTEKDTTDDDTITFTATISGNNAALVMSIEENDQTVTVTMNTAKVIGAGTTFDGTAWQLTSVKMANTDTSATYTLTSSEIQVFYLTAGTVYMVENGVSIDSIFEVLALEMMGVEPIDSTEAIDTLAAIAGTDGIDSSMSYVLNGDVIGIFETNDTTDLDIDISAGELTLTMDLEDGSTLEENFELFLGAGSIEGSIWQLTDLTASNSDTSIDYTLTTGETFLAYFYNGKFYIVEKGVDLYEDVIGKLFDDLEGYGNPVGKWYVEIYEELHINTDTSYSADSVTGDTIYTILDISAGKFITYDYDDEEKVIEVDEVNIDVSSGGEIVIDANKTFEVVEENGVLTFTMISDYSDEGYGYYEETFTCKPYSGTIPPAYWVVDTSDLSSAKTLTTDGTVDSGSIDTTNNTALFKFAALAGKAYQIVASSEEDTIDIDMDIYYMEGTLKNIVVDEEDEAVIKISSNLTYFIEVSTDDISADFTIFVKVIDAIATPTEAINNWYCSSLPLTDSLSLTFTQDSSVFYTTITSDSIKVHLMSEGVKQTMEDIFVFANGNKCYFFGDEFSYTLSATTFSMTSEEMSFVFSVFTGTTFPPDKYVDFGELMKMGGGRSILDIK